ncbi:hypothetical protein AKL17_3p0162 (plasmid) [Frigidibacter mobilis]|uniref:Uncharacterized protein n=1 Tax=Frigidibacter mobilis TaxID=1335048 RepID=A0A159ZBC9_9RHOB|nr:hypothetical protein AKL17_3p0162 [Frigidibacter mobilis]
MLHGTTEIAGFPQKLYKTLQAMASKTAAFQRKINDMDVVQGELPSWSGPSLATTWAT